MGELDQPTSRGPSKLNYHVTLWFLPAEKSLSYISITFTSAVIISPVSLSSYSILTLHLLIDTNLSQQGELKKNIMSMFSLLISK